MSNALINQLNNPQSLSQVNQRAAAVISLLLVVACAYVLVEITWMFFPQDESSASPAPVRSNVAVVDNTQQQNFRKLTAANLFGESKKAAVVKQTNAPVTKLNLRLKGVLAATPMERASAIISKGANGKEDIFSVGDKVSGGVAIKEIHPDHVVLERNGRLEILKLQKVSGVKGAVASRSSSSTSLSQASSLKQIRSDILKNPTSFGQYALPVVVKENGKQIGYRLQPQSKGKMLSEMGIQASDVITKINGVSLDKPQNGISALRKLSTASNLNLVVKRNGAEIPLNISLQ